MRIEYHRTLINDRVRVAAFYEALNKLIKPGETIVADIGAGTGLLAVLAARLGAKHVYLYEASEVAGVAAEVLKKNRIRNAELFVCHSTEFDEPPKVDLVVSETLGNYALEEDLIETLADAAMRHLKPGGVLIPSGVRQFVAPVTAPRFDAELRVWDKAIAGLADVDLSPAKALSLNNIYVRTIAPKDIHDGVRGAVEWDRIALGRERKSARKGEASWRFDHPSIIHGFALWWTVDLAPEVQLSTSPEAPATHWEQLYLPLDEPIAMKAGEKLSIALRSRTSREYGTTIAWTSMRFNSRDLLVEKQVMDLEKGFLP